MLIDDILKHYGVRGMKWGVRKEKKPASSPAPKPVTLKSRFGNRVVTAKGGKGYGLSEDATRAAVLKRQARKSNVRSLSNKELSDLVLRMNLEQQYSRLNQNNILKGRDQVKELLSISEVAQKAYSEVKKASR